MAKSTQQRFHEQYVFPQFRAVARMYRRMGLVEWATKLMHDVEYMEAEVATRQQQQETPND